MANVGYATLQIIPSTKGIGAALDKQVNPALGKSGKTGGKALTGGIMGSVKGVAGPLAAAFGTAALIGGFKESIGLASEFSETLNKSNVIFGPMAGNIEEWSKGSVRSLGLSQGAALATAAQFGDMFKQIGFGGPQVAGLSKDFLQLSADIGSFQNAETGDVTAAFQSALRGEFESIQRFLPNLKAARVETEAMAMSGKTNAKQLTAQDKAMALYSLATKDGASASNDFAETQGGQAGQAKILAANIENLKTKFGAILLPAMTAVTTFANSTLLPAFANIGPILERIGGVVGPAFATIRDALTPVVETLRTSLLPAFEAVSSFVTANISPILAILGGILGGVLLGAFVSIAGVVGGAVVAALGALIGVLASPVVIIGALVGALIYAYNNFEGFRDVVDRVVAFVIGTVIPGFIEFGKAVIEAVGDAVAFVKSIWPQIQEAIGHVLEAVKTIVSTFVEVVVALWKAFGDDLLSLIKAAFEFIKSTVSNAIDLIKGVITTALAIINGDWGKAWEGIKDILDAFWEQAKNIINLAWEAIKTIFGLAFSAIKAAADLGWEAVKSVFSLAWTALKTVVSDGIGAAVDLVTALPGKFKDALSSLGSTIKTVATNAWSDFKGAVTDGIGDAVTLAKGLPGKIKSGLGDLFGLLQSAGGDLMRGFAKGIGDAAGAVIGKAVEIANGIKDAVADALGIKSPSKVFMELGRYTGEGFALGIDSMADAVQSSMAAMAAPPAVSSWNSAHGSSGISVAGSSANQASAIAVLTAEVIGLRAEVRRQTDRGALLTRTGVAR